MSSRRRHRWNDSPPPIWRIRFRIGYGPFEQTSRPVDRYCVVMAIGVGDVAPDFTLEGTGGPFTLENCRGHSVVLAFYPGDNTPVCTMQLNSYSEEIEAFEDLDTLVVGLSPQSVSSHEEFSTKQGGFNFPLLADTDKAVGKLYGILGPLGFYRRSVFVIDPKGIVTYAHRSATGVTFRRTEELVSALAKTAN